MRGFAYTLGVCGALLTCAGGAWADTVYVGKTPYENVTIEKIDGDKIVYQFNGHSTSKDLDRIERIIVTNETALDGAEEAFAAGKWDDAVDGYQKAIRATAKTWVKDWAAMRLIAAAGKTNRFDAAVLAYIATVMKDPVAAQKNKPTPPDSKSSYLDTAVKDINDALGNGKLTDEQRIALLSFLIDVHNARKDSKAVDQTSEKLDETLAKNPNNPQAGRALARRHIQAAQQALESKNYAKVVAEIETNRTQFSDPIQQADALWYLAEAKLGTAADGNATALQDVALAYMRVVAHFKDLPGRPHVIDALMRTAGIQERIGDTQTASTIYQQIATQFPDDPVSAKAKENIARLKLMTPATTQSTQPDQMLTP